MPHAGLIASTLSKEDELLLRARLHVRGGRMRLSKGNHIDAIAAFYDAFVSAMLRYVYSPVLCRKLNVRENDDIAEDLSLFRVLRRSGVVSCRFDETDFQLFSSLLDSAMEGVTPSFDERMFLEKYDTVMTELGILPIAANMLPEGESITL